MPGNPTPNLGLIVPTVGGDNNTWGTELNTDLALLDAAIGTHPIVVVNSGTTIVLAQPVTVVKVTTGASNQVVTISSPVVGWIIILKKMDATAGWAVVTPNSGLIDGAAIYNIVNQNEAVQLCWDGTNWLVVGKA